jgi:hypothetical protein
LLIVAMGGMVMLIVLVGDAADHADEHLGQVARWPPP